MRAIAAPNTDAEKNVLMTLLDVFRRKVCNWVQFLREFVFERLWSNCVSLSTENLVKAFQNKSRGHECHCVVVVCSYIQLYIHLYVIKICLAVLTVFMAGVIRPREKCQSIQKNLQVLRSAEVVF